MHIEYRLCVKLFMASHGHGGGLSHLAEITVVDGAVGLFVWVEPRVLCGPNGGSIGRRNGVALVARAAHS